MIILPRSPESYLSEVFEYIERSEDIDESKRDIFIVNSINHGEGALGIRSGYSTATVIQVNKVVVNNKSNYLKNADSHLLKFIYVYTASIAEPELNASNFSKAQLLLKHAIGTGCAEWFDKDGNVKYYDNYGFKLIQSRSHDLISGVFEKDSWSVHVNVSSGAAIDDNLTDYIFRIPDPTCYTEDQLEKYNADGTITGYYKGSDLMNDDTRVKNLIYDENSKFVIRDWHENIVQLPDVINRSGEITELIAILSDLSSDVYAPLNTAMINAAVIVYVNKTGHKKTGASFVDRYKPTFHRVHPDKIENEMKAIERTFKKKCDSIASDLGPIQVMYYYTDTVSYYRVEFLDSSKPFKNVSFINNLDNILNTYEQYTDTINTDVKYLQH